MNGDVESDICNENILSPVFYNTMSSSQSVLLDSDPVTGKVTEEHETHCPDSDENIT